MPLDGLSFTNAGIYKIPNAMEVEMLTQQSSQAQAEVAVKKTEKGEQLKHNTNESDSEDETNAEGRYTDNNDESESQNNESFNSGDEINILKYRVSFNQSTDSVELIDRITGNIAESISPKDLISLVSKSKGASGILVDKQI